MRGHVHWWCARRGADSSLASAAWFNNKNTRAEHIRLIFELHVGSLWSTVAGARSLSFTRHSEFVFCEENTNLIFHKHPWRRWKERFFKRKKKKKFDIKIKVKGSRASPSSNHINVMCCVSRVFTKKASSPPPELDLPFSTGCIIARTATRCGPILHERAEPEGLWRSVCACVHACVCSRERVWVRRDTLYRATEAASGLSKAFFFSSFTPTNLQGAFSICSVCSLWKTSDSFFKQSQMRQCESVRASAWVCQCMRVWGEYLPSREKGRERRVVWIFFFLI